MCQVDAPAQETHTRLRLRLLFEGDAMFGPGKADLLQLIRDAGSISEAGRQMGMSYKRAWSLVEEMNRDFRAPLVDSARGGPGGGGAKLTATGAEVLGQYRALERCLAQEGAPQIVALQALLRDISGEK